MNLFNQSAEGSLARELYKARDAQLQSNLLDSARQISQNSLSTNNPVSFEDAKGRVLDAFNKANNNPSLFIKGTPTGKSEQDTSILVPNNIVSPDTVQQMVAKTQQQLASGSLASGNNAAPKITGNWVIDPTTGGLVQSQGH
jgi:hypothetical protein